MKNVPQEVAQKISIWDIIFDHNTVNYIHHLTIKNCKNF